MIVLIFTFFACLTFSLLNKNMVEVMAEVMADRSKKDGKKGQGLVGVRWPLLGDCGGGAVLPNWDNRRRAGGVSR